ncbi:MAG: VOC family protein [Bacteroidota bacterium]|nr:VOC family protein [Bacteroidota bacterium]MDP4218019.1 VOC family protein [Bacteroidota bacterium]MDP4253442.1 VOC family protein [Bacteroidota bacterium]MDP4256877.1 VOC family protein [Bacteroidota bacterium]
MNQRLAHISLLVREYDEAIDFYTKVLGFDLVEDTPLTPEKRWVLVRPKGATGGCMLLLARAATEEQKKFIGNQSGGRVFLFLYTDDFDRDYQLYKDRGVIFVRPPKVEPYGTVAVFKDLYGHQWDLLQPA